MFCTNDEFKQMKEAETPEILNEILSRVFNKAIERSLCLIPDVVNKLNKKIQVVGKYLGEYFGAHPEFKDHKDIVMKVVQELEFEHTGMAFEAIMEKATAIIEKRIANVKGGSNG